VTISQAFRIAVQHHQAGRLSEAEALYRQVLAAQPNHADALHFLGVIAHQIGRDDLAVAWVRQAIALDPNNPVAHSNLGEAYRTMGRLDESIAACRRALQIKSDFPEAHYNLGNALRERGQLNEAVKAYHRALEFRVGYPKARVNLGIAFRQLGRLDEAVAAFRHALELDPDIPEAYNSLGHALRDLGQFADAIAAIRRALQLKPGYQEAHINLGAALAESGQLDEAVAACRRALELKPDDTATLNNLGNALKDRGELDEAIAAYRRALQRNPQEAGTHSNLVYALHFHPGYDRKRITEEHQRWNLQFSEPLKQFGQAHANDRNRERRLRIGYVSPDFREHPVGRYALPWFERHDQERFETFCYSGVFRPDWITARFRALAGQWRNTVGVSDSGLAEMIREDRVDILVDLTQHMAGNRLPVFARKPAPVQVSFAGYPESTGLKAIEYRISDRFLDAVSTDEAIDGEERVCKIDSFYYYDPCGIEVEVNPLPALENGIVTFGCLNNFSKANEQVLRLWARVLGKANGSRLVISSRAGSHRQRTLEALEKAGVAASRVEFVNICPRREYLELYHHIDVALDTFPYNGGMTTCDALWMGAPVPTFAGKMPISRAGLSLLSNVGLHELVAQSEEDYVRITVELAGNLPRLANLRATLRRRMQASPLMDAPRFARNVEAAYRSMWERWCAAPK
jgi:protein O-GlcNAc transferase